MRFVLTILAVALVAALSAALAIPVFIDWTGHRAQIEARLSAMTGTSVRIAGPIAARLLPVPYIDLQDAVMTGASPDAPRLSVGHARLELALVKLMGGQIVFSEAEFDGAELSITRSPDGGLGLPFALPEGRAEAITLERVAVRDSALTLVGSDGASRTIKGVDLDASAQSLAGPFSGAGRVATGEGEPPIAFRFSTGPVLADGATVKAIVLGDAARPELTLDGAVEKAPARDGAAADLRYVGDASLAGVTAGGDGRPVWPWRLSGRLTLDGAGAALNSAAFALGPEERALQASGDMRLAFGAPARLAATLVARPLNIDALFRVKDSDRTPPAVALSLLVGALAPMVNDSDWAVASTVQIASPSVVVGGEPLTDFTLAASSAPGERLHTNLSVGLPGASRLAAEGDWEGGVAPSFHGAIDAAAGDYATLRDWATAGAPQIAARLDLLETALPYRSAALTGVVTLSGTTFSGPDVTLTLDRTKLAGSVFLTPPIGAERGRVAVDLGADSLDVDSLPNLSAGSDLVSDLDVSFALRAKALHIARVGETAVDGGSLDLKVERTGDTTTLKRFEVSGLGGAEVEAKGEMSPDGRSLSGRLVADKLRDLAFLASRVAPGETTQLLLARADALSPAKLNFEAHGRAGAFDGSALDSLKAEGSLGATLAMLSLKQDDAARVANLTLDSPDAGALMRQFGLRAAPGTAGKAHISALARGDLTSGLDGQAAMTLAGADATFRGKLWPAASSPSDDRLSGVATLRGADLSPLLQTLAMASGGGGVVGPFDASAQVSLRGGRWSIANLVGNLAGAKFNGALVYHPDDQRAASLADADVALAQAVAGETPSPPTSNDAPPVALEGNLSFDRLPLAGVLSLELGSPSAPKPPARWSDARFAPAPVEPPATLIALTVGALDLGEAGQAQGFRTKLRLGRAKLDLDDIATSLGSGTAAGRLTVQRDHGLAALNGAVKLDGADLSRAGFIGRLGARFDFASTGQSVAGLVEGLAGQGELQLAGASLPKSDPDALTRVVAKSQADDAQLDETNIAHNLDLELDKRSVALPDGVAPMAASGGVVRFGPIPLTRSGGDASLAASLDLRTLALETRLTLTDRQPLKFWSAGAPSATATVANALGAPTRRLDVSALSAGLAAQAIARETERIAELEADMRERAYFNRVQKAFRAMNARDADLAAWVVDQARLKSLAERRHAEAEAQRVVDERAAAEKAAAEKAAADKAAADKAAAERQQPALPQELPASGPDLATPPPPSPTGAPPPRTQDAAPPPPLPPVKPKPPKPADPLTNPLY